MTAPRSGFALVEVLVALLVLEVGLLGVAALVALSARVTQRASALERALFAAEGVVDSLATVPVLSDGERSTPTGRIRWSVSAPGADGPSVLHVSVADRRGRSVLELHALLGGRPVAEGG